MARYIVPPKNELIIKCRECGTLYVPEKIIDKYGKAKFSYLMEPCPICGFTANTKNDQIPLWKYNLIRWFRRNVK